MRWRGRRESDNVEDRRGQRGGGGRMGFPFPMPGGRGGGRRGGFSITTLLIIGVIMWFLGFNPLDLLRGGSGGGGVQLPDQVNFPRLDRGQQGQQNNPFNIDLPRLDRQRADRSGQPEIDRNRAEAKRDDMSRFIAVVLADTEDVWTKQMRALGRSYRRPKLVLFTGYTNTGCGAGMAQMGPFYCPLDQKIYVDLSFYDELKTKFGASGDFAQAYVIAHEVGHHVQTLQGIASAVQRAKSRTNKKTGNRIQVAMELQADCLAGVWANRTESKGVLEQGDIEEALNAAAAIGDDRIQKRTQGYVVPDAFTHGSSVQRKRWFYAGYESGDMRQCDTFTELKRGNL